MGNQNSFINCLSSISNQNNNINPKIIVNGHKRSNELIIVFELNETSINVYDKLMQWLFKSLDLISDRVYDGLDYNWNIISQILYNDYENENIEDNNICILNTIIVLIHISDDRFKFLFDDNQLTIPFNNISQQLFGFSPSEIINCLTPEPSFIKNIGISAVSSTVMMRWWKDLISIKPNFFCFVGKGNNIHPMWIKDKFNLNNNKFWGNWVCINEKSSTFEWN